MRTAIFGRNLKSEDVQYIQELFDLLLEKDIDFTIYDKFQNHLVNRIKFGTEVKTFKSAEEISGEVDYIFSIGGDGTLLNTLPLVMDSGIPIVGINFGRLGFLSTIGKKEIPLAMSALRDKSYRIDNRTLVHLDSNRELFDGVPFALNEFTIHKKDASSMIIIHVYINGEFLNSYWADGLIVSTPTGSTGYSLSCGGPIIFPNSGNLVITPVAPHNLNVRPIVVSDDSVVSFEVEGRVDGFLVTLDSRYEEVDEKIQLAIRKEDFTANLIRLPDSNYLSTLRNKLKLGLDSRN